MKNLDRKRRTDRERIIDEAIAMETESAREAGALGYYARVLTQATLPHSRPTENVFKRSNGALTVTIMADPDIGLPYGPKVRLLLAWLTTEAVRTRERQVILGDSLSGFMRKLGLMPTGGRWGSITSLKEQSKRLFSCSIKAVHDTDARWQLERCDVVDSADLWWHPKSPDQTGIWASSVTLSEHFYQEVIGYPVPIDLRAVRALSRSPLALDIYSWLTYRMSYLKQPARIPWELLELQFGSDYQETRIFKYKFLKQLRSVLAIYNADVRNAGTALELRPSPSHIPHLSCAKPSQS